jgi:hypothetical protein
VESIKALTGYWNLEIGENAEFLTHSALAVTPERSTNNTIVEFGLDDPSIVEFDGYKYFKYPVSLTLLRFLGSYEKTLDTPSGHIDFYHIPCRFKILVIALEKGNLINLGWITFSSENEHMLYSFYEEIAREFCRIPD